MNKFLMSGATALALVAVVTAAQAAPQAPAPGRPGMMKTETRTEVPTQVQRIFSRLDVNKDGAITKAEADAMKNQVEQKVEKVAQRMDSGKMFTRLDTNHDGNITRAEADAAFAARAAKAGKPANGKPGFAGLFARGDTNKDGVITRAEFDAETGQMKARMERAGAMRGGMGERIFTTADVNKDGKVTLPEMQQVALQRFDRADLNKDGQVTPQERQQLREQMKVKR